MTRVPWAPSVRASVAFALSLILPGAGSFYLGRRRTAYIALGLETLGSLLLALLWYLGVAGGLALLIGLLALTVGVHLGGALVATREALRGSTKRPFWQTIGYLMLAACALIAMQSLSRSQLMAVYAVATIAMEPTLEHGDRVLVEPHGADHDYRRGEIVALNDPDSNENFVRRLVGLAGDRVRIHDAEVSVNGRSLRVGPCEPGAGPASAPAAEADGTCYLERSQDGLSYRTVDHIGDGSINLEVIVPAGKIFVMRDRRDLSIPLDPMERGWLKGVVRDIWWSYTYRGPDLERVGLHVAPDQETPRAEAPR